MLKPRSVLIPLLIIASTFLEGCQVTPYNVGANQNNQSNKASSTPQPSLHNFDNVLGLITDKSTNLQWRRCALGRNWDVTNNKCKGNATKGVWLDMVRLVKVENYAGFSDWRLPTEAEYLSLVGRNKSTCVAIDKATMRFFPGNENTFDGEHWLADNSNDLMSPKYADLNLSGNSTGQPFLNCRETKSRLPHNTLKAVMVRGGAIPNEWIFAASNLKISKQLDAKSKAEGKRQWDSANTTLSNILPKIGTPSSISSSSSNYCGSGDTCYQLVAREKDRVKIHCIKGSNTGQEKAICGPHPSTGKWKRDCSLTSFFHHRFEEAAKLACE